jgi:hypothetical protein
MSFIVGNHADYRDDGDASHCHPTANTMLIRGVGAALVASRHAINAPHRASTMAMKRIAIPMPNTTMIHA